MIMRQPDSKHVRFFFYLFSFALLSRLLADLNRPYQFA